MSTSKPRRGRPPLSEDVARLEIRIPAALLEQATEAAGRDGVSVAEWVRAALHEALARPRLSAAASPR